MKAVIRYHLLVVYIVHSTIFSGFLNFLPRRGGGGVFERMERKGGGDKGVSYKFPLLTIAENLERKVLKHKEYLGNEDAWNRAVN